MPSERIFSFQSIHFFCNILRININRHIPFRIGNAKVPEGHIDLSTLDITRYQDDTSEVKRGNESVECPHEKQRNIAFE